MLDLNFVFAVFVFGGLVLAIVFMADNRDKLGIEAMDTLKKFIDILKFWKK